MKITKDLIGKNIIRYSKCDIGGRMDGSYMDEPLEVLDVGESYFLIENTTFGMDYSVLKLDKWDDNKWNLYKKGCLHWGRKKKYCSECGTKL